MYSKLTSTSNTDIYQQNDDSTNTTQTWTIAVRVIWVYIVFNDCKVNKTEAILFILLYY